LELDRRQQQPDDDERRVHLDERISSRRATDCCEAFVVQLNAFAYGARLASTPYADC